MSVAWGEISAFAKRDAELASIRRRKNAVTSEDEWDTQPSQLSAAVLEANITIRMLAHARMTSCGTLPAEIRNGHRESTRFRPVTAPAFRTHTTARPSECAQRVLSQRKAKCLVHA